MKGEVKGHCPYRHPFAKKSILAYEGRILRDNMEIGSVADSNLQTQLAQCNSTCYQCPEI